MIRRQVFLVYIDSKGRQNEYSTKLSDKSISEVITKMETLSEKEDNE